MGSDSLYGTSFVYGVECSGIDECWFCGKCGVSWKWKSIHRLKKLEKGLRIGYHLWMLKGWQNIFTEEILWSGAAIKLFLVVWQLCSVVHIVWYIGSIVWLWHCELVRVPMWCQIRILKERMLFESDILIPFCWKVWLWINTRMWEPTFEYFWKRAGIKKAPIGCEMCCIWFLCVYQLWQSVGSFIKFRLLPFIKTTLQLCACEQQQ